jgi:hypothetical protein
MRRGRGTRSLSRVLENLLADVFESLPRASTRAKIER